MHRRLVSVFRPPLARVLFLSFLSVLVYLNALGNDFVTDDIPSIVANRNLGNFLHSLSDIRNFSLVPLTLTINYLIGGFDPTIYHATNILFHILATVFAYLLLRELFSEKPSFFAALLFATHPIHIEAVTWISGRPYPASAFLVLASLWLFVAAVKREKLWPRYYFSILFFVLSLLFSQLSLVMPLLAVLSLVSLRKFSQNWRWLVPYFFIGLGFLFLLREIVQTRLEYINPGAGENPSFLRPFLWIPIQIAAFLYILLLPSHIAYFHQESLDPRFVSLPAGTAVSVFLLLLLFYSYRKSREVFFAVGFFLLALSPVLLPVHAGNIVSDRYGYLPSLGYCLLLAFVILEVSDGIPFKNLNPKLIAPTFLLTLVFSYSFLTVFRNRDWQNEGTLWEATLLSSPKSSKAHAGMGLYFLKLEQIDLGIGWFKQALALNPKEYEAFWALGLAYYLKGDYRQAVDYYTQSISINPNLAFPHYGLGLAFSKLGEDNMARSHFEAAARLNPDAIFSVK